MLQLARFFFSPFLGARLKKARAHYEDQPGALSAVDLAEVLVKSGENEEAFQVVSEAKRRFPGDAVLQKTYNSIRKERAQKKLKSVSRRLRRGSDVDMYLQAAGLCRTLGNFKSAIAYIEKAAHAYPDHWHVEFALGQLYFSRFADLHKHEDSVTCLEHLRRARELNPRSRKVLLFLALTTTRLGHYDEATPLVETVLRQFPEDPQALSIQTYIERATAGPARGRAGAVRKGRTTRPVISPEDTVRVQRILQSAEALPSISAVYTFDKEAVLIDSTLKPNDVFKLEGTEGAVGALANGCKLDATRMGMGELQSCLILGTGWQILVRSLEGFDVVAFLNEASPESITDNYFDEVLLQEQPQSCATS